MVQDERAEACDAALEELRQFNGPVLIDLDETLYLRNSTEDFIDCARPALIAWALLKLLDLLRPWRWTGPDTRDVWRVRLVLLLFPWTTALWLRKVPRLAGRFANAPLRVALHARAEPPVIATLGFRTIVRPLLDALGFPGARLVAPRVQTAADRREGKLALVISALGEGAVRRALCLTDSPQDQPLLDLCARTCLVTWPGARFRPAFSGLYLPGRYLTRIKRPGKKYIRRSILQDDFVLWLLASVWLAAYPVLHTAGLLALLLSFWAVYEQGYVDNDRIAHRLEADPRLTPEFGLVEVATPAAAPWVWAALAGITGLALLRWPALPSAADLASWAAVLAATALCFRLFNRLDKVSRVWPYALLQLARCAAFVPLVPLVPAAPAAIGAQVIEKWVPYFMYRHIDRHGGGTWEIPLHLMRLVFLTVLLLVTAAAQGARILIEPPTLAILGFALLRAARQIGAATRSARRIDRPARYQHATRQPTRTTAQEPPARAEPAP